MRFNYGKGITLFDQGFNEKGVQFLSDHFRYHFYRASLFMRFNYGKGITLFDQGIRVQF